MTNCITETPDVQLFRQAQAGDAASLDALMQRHDGLVHHIIRKQCSGPLTYAEVLQEGRIGLWRAILRFDPHRGTAFSTYASVAIARHVWQAVRQAQQPIPPEEVAPLLVQPTNPQDASRHLEIDFVLHTLVEQLPPKQRWIVRAYYGLAGSEPHTLAQLGQLLGCTHQAVHYHLRRALFQLRHPAFSATLRALLGRNRRQDYLRALQSEGRRS
ncbi:MAG: sigma-70 family RNA polymerase sigma factor [Anaerolineae bacterium]